MKHILVAALVMFSGTAYATLESALPPAVPGSDATELTIGSMSFDKVLNSMQVAKNPEILTMLLDASTQLKVEGIEAPSTYQVVERAKRNNPQMAGLDPSTVQTLCSLAVPVMAVVGAGALYIQIIQKVKELSPKDNKKCKDQAQVIVEKSRGVAAEVIQSASVEDAWGEALR